jgi:hypothetical protein
MKDDKWSFAIHQAIGRNANAFVTSNGADAMKLRRLMREVCNGSKASYHDVLTVSVTYCDSLAAVFGDGGGQRRPIQAPVWSYHNHGRLSAEFSRLCGSRLAAVTHR